MAVRIDGNKNPVPRARTEETLNQTSTAQAAATQASAQAATQQAPGVGNQYESPDQARMRSFIRGPANLANESTAQSAPEIRGRFGTSSEHPLTDADIQLTEQSRVHREHMLAVLRQQTDGLRLDVDFAATADSTGAWPAAKGEAFVPGLNLVDLDALPYLTDGSTALTGTESAKKAVGMLVVAADNERGLVLADVNSRDVARDRKPETKTLLTPQQLAQNDVVRRRAEDLGLDPAGLEVTFNEVQLSGGGYADKHLTTVLLNVDVVDQEGNILQNEEFSAILAGNPSLGLSALRLGTLEEGVAGNRGYSYPPSVAAAAKAASGATE